MALRKILIADDHFLIRAGVKQMISQLEDVELAAEAISGKDVLRLFEELRPELLLLDISLPDMTGIEVTEKIMQQYPAAKIIILSMHNDGEYISKCIELGVKGYVIKNESADELQYAVKAVLAGKEYFSREVQDVIFRKYTTSVIKKTTREVEKVTLTNRERDILQLLADGMTSNQIADRLFISTRTVETHRANLMKKLDAKNAIDLLRKVHEQKLMDT
ncbi:MAG TPA: response regulator transcription factor [Chryseosolibacter sp.]